MSVVEHAGIGVDAAVSFDHGKTDAPIHVHFPEFEDTVHLTGDHFSKALGVGSSTLNNVSGFSVTRATNHHPSDPVAVFVKEGTPEQSTTLPCHTRVVGVSTNGNTMAAHAVVPSGTHAVDMKHEFCHSISRGEAQTEYIHPSALTPEDHARNATRALKWNQHIGITEEQLDEHVVVAEKDGVTRVALPMDPSAGPLGQLVANKTKEERAMMFPQCAQEPTEFENPKLGATVPHIVMTKQNWEDGKKTFIQNMKPKFGHHGLTISRKMITGVHPSHPLDVQLVVHRRPHPICLEDNKFKGKTLHEASEVAGVPITAVLAGSQAPEQAKKDIVAAAIFNANVGDGVSGKSTTGASLVSGPEAPSTADPIVGGTTEEVDGGDAE